MGEYLTLRFHAPLSILGENMATRLDRYNGASWAQIAVEFPSFQMTPAWEKETRKSFIPYGGIMYVPEGWEDRHINEVLDRVWHVQCSVKTLCTLKTFAKDILPQFLSAPCEIEWELEYPFMKGTIPVEPSPIAKEQMSTISGRMAINRLPPPLQNFPVGKERRLPEKTKASIRAAFYGKEEK
jgi:hypothetical protein